MQFKSAVSIMRALTHVRPTDDDGNSLELTVLDYRDLYRLTLDIQLKKPFRKPVHFQPRQPIEHVSRTALKPKDYVPKPKPVEKYRAKDGKDDADCTKPEKPKKPEKPFGAPTSAKVTPDKYDPNETKHAPTEDDTIRTTPTKDERPHIDHSKLTEHDLKCLWAIMKGQKTGIYFNSHVQESDQVL